MKLLLDTNAVIKRYVAERGSDIIETVYRSADAGEIQLGDSLWTLGEGFGVLDRLDRQGRRPNRGGPRRLRRNLGEAGRPPRFGGPASPSPGGKPGPQAP